MAYRAASSATTSLIDLIGYRRFGHNEADEPAYTQPVMTPQIKRHEPRRATLYAAEARSTTAWSRREEVEAWQRRSGTS